MFFVTDAAYRDTEELGGAVRIMKFFNWERLNLKCSMFKLLNGIWNFLFNNLFNLQNNEILTYVLPVMKSIKFLNEATLSSTQACKCNYSPQSLWCLKSFEILYDSRNLNDRQVPPSHIQGRGSVLVLEKVFEHQKTLFEKRR